jgi:DNA-binding protein
VNATPKETVIVGLKPVMNYVVACMTLFNSGADQVKARARGRNISKAVEVVEMLRRVFLTDLVIADIKIGTEHHVKPDGKEASVSVIEFFLENGSPTHASGEVA